MKLPSAIYFVPLLFVAQGFAIAGSGGAQLPQEGMVLWLDATDLDGNDQPDDVLVDHSPVVTWSDKSGQSNHVEQTEPAAQPTLEFDQLGGQRVVRFHGDDLLARSKFDGFVYRDQPIHVVLVMRTQAAATHATPRLIEFQPVEGDLSKPATVKQHGLWIGPRVDGRNRLATHYGDEGSARSVAWDGQPHVVEVVYAGAQSWVHYLDGARDGGGLLGDRDFQGFTKDLRLAVGQHFGGTDPDSYFEGDLAEVLIYNRMLSAEEQNAVKTYLAEKYSLPLAIEAVPDFQRDVLPILAQHCHECHGTDEPEAGVDLRTVAAMPRGGERGPVIARGHPEFSDVLDLIAKGKMPPEGEEPVSPEKVAVLRRWIEAGAPADEEIQAASTAQLITEEDRSFWAFKKLVRHEPSSVNRTEVSLAPIDQFVVAALQRQRLNLAPPADRNSLLRRVYFDLIGLPPAPEEIDAFLADTNEGAFERVVDRLLHSEHFGERWGRHWLDWSGYVDVLGKDNDFAIIKPLESKWRYRDYVVRSFNQDKPLNRFIVEQLAGDELVDWRSADKFTPDIVELLTATGFLLCSDDDTDQNELNTPDIRYHVLQNTGEIVASNLFALTTQCSKCHNHKYEALPQQDYYRWLANFSAVFNPQRWVTSVEHGIPDVSKKDKTEIDAHNAELDRQIAQLKQQQETLRAQTRQRISDQKLAGLPEPIRADAKGAIETAAEKRTEVQKYLADKLGPSLNVTPEELAAALSDEDKSQLADADAKISSLNAQRRSYGTIQVAIENSPPSATYLLRRGEVTKPGMAVEPALFAILSEGGSQPDTDPSTNEPLHPVGQTSGRRLAIARQVTDPDSIAGALVARVFVNRLWQELFGVGIVATSDNFGVSGARPSHPELLDWLATELIRGGWRVKPLIKLMIMSRAYQQASVRDDAQRCEDADPSNSLLWRARLRRLPSEIIRDTILAVSGKLDRTVGGAPIPLEAKPDGMIVVKKEGLPTPTSQWRRSMYILNRRNYHLSILTTFDQPFLTANCTHRKPAAVVTQSLTMLNDEVVLEHANHFAERVVRQCPGVSPEKRVDTAYKIALARHPTDAERTRCADLIRRHVARYEQESMPAEQGANKALAHFCHILFNTSEFLYVQ